MYHFHSTIVPNTDFTTSEEKNIYLNFIFRNGSKSYQFCTYTATLTKRI